MVGKQTEYNFLEMQKKFDKFKECFRELAPQIEFDNNSTFKGYSETLEFFSQKELFDINNENILKHINNIPVIVKLCSIISTLGSDCKFSNDVKNQLKKLIKREKNKKDGSQSYQDMLFEFSIVSRFVESLNNYNIDLSTDCDLIINQNIAIECKYIHGANKLEDNIKKARRQIYKRINSELAKIGIIAVDMSNLLSSNTFNGIIDVHEEYSSQEEMLLKFKGFYSKHVIDKLDMEIGNIHNNKIFSDSNTIHAVLLQSFNFVVIDLKDSYIPFVSRILYPIYNPSLSEEERLKLSPIIKSLEIGY